MGLLMLWPLFMAALIWYVAIHLPKRGYLAATRDNPNHPANITARLMRENIERMEREYLEAHRPPPKDRKKA